MAGDSELLARIDERTKAMKEKLDNHISTVNRLVGGHEKRLRGLETRLAWVLGAGTGAGAIAGVVAAVVFRALGG